MNAIIANDLTKKYGNVAAVKGINLEIPEGTVFGILGREGAGKTTLVKLLCGLCSSDFGSCSVMGISPKESSERVRALCGVIIDSAKLYENISVMENLAFFGKLCGMTGTEARDRASFLMHSFGIWDDRDQSVEKITTNRKKLVSICRALIASPKVLLLDDCFDGFDSALVSDVSGMIRSLASEEGMTVLITGASTGGFDICDCFAVISEGAVLAKGSMEALLKQSGLKRRTSLRTLDGKLSLALDGFVKTDAGVYEKDIDSEQDMADIISRAVYLGNKLVEAKIYTPDLAQIFDYYIGTEEDYD